MIIILVIIMFVLHSKYAFSEALEGVASKIFRSLRSRTILPALVCTQQLSYSAAFTFALFHYNHDVVSVIVSIVAVKEVPVTQFSST